MVKYSANGSYLIGFDEYYQYESKNTWPKSSRLKSIHNESPTTGDRKKSEITEIIKIIVSLVNSFSKLR